jgi:hypothetical protein
MRDDSKKSGGPSDTAAAVLLGSVVGLILGSTLAAGICGWKLWAAETAATDGSSSRVPSPTYTAPASAYPSYSSGPSSYGTYPVQPTLDAAGQPTGDNAQQPGYYSGPTYGGSYSTSEAGSAYSAPGYVPSSPTLPDSAEPAPSEDEETSDDY